MRETEPTPSPAELRVLAEAGDLPATLTLRAKALGLDRLRFQSLTLTLRAKALGLDCPSAQSLRPTPHATAYADGRTVNLDGADRLSIELRDHGVTMASGKGLAIDAAVQIASRWLVERSLCSVLVFYVPALKASGDSLAYERGYEVDWHWKRQLDRVESSSPELRDFVVAASKRPELRQLFPFQSMFWFCLSRCSGFPFTADIPGTHWDRDAFVVSRKLVGYEWEPIGRGDAEEAVEIVVANLPSNCGPAVFATADELDAMGKDS